MRIGQLTEHFFFSGQIEPEYVPMLAEHGFRTILCNRPDGEDWGPGRPRVRPQLISRGLTVFF